ncbi:hypothetical protein M501DRAFT_501334 [Patellaria atrata CBS 101060]|uniref:Zn(2)-C6 fungal-type domain-containing protein n=1 Tax=Patellaria atrata CBS 101060 TaxID=1346257 RepID=A0A9P4S225_9PEZI|nr:hypothetical protein M501DRAFT_501334 [Patellaria atrata CBS 101060]
MEGGDPLDRQDVKRIRLEPHHYSDPPRPGQPHSTPRPQHPQNPHDLHQPRPYQPSHQSGPQPPPRNHPHQPQPYPSGYRESTIPPHENRPPLPPTDYRQLPPPVTGVSESNQHAFHNSRSGSSSSAPMNPNKPWQAHEAGYSRPPSNPLQPSPSDPPRPLTLTTNIHEQNRPMEHGHHSMYPSTEHHPNGLPPNGFHSSAPHEAYGGPPVGPNQSYMSTPLTPYPPTPFGPGPQAYTLGARKKTVRAQQACNTCRSRKQKCNEARPCDFCKENNLECEYKEVPPPK